MADKNRREKEVYRRLLRESFPFENATYSHDSLKEKVNQASDILNRDDQEDKKIDTTARPLPALMKIGDKIRENWLPGLVIAAIFFILGLLYNQGVDIGIVKSDIANVQQSLDDLKDKYEKVSDSNLNVKLLKVEFGKDLEFLKEKIRGMESKLSQ